jgi:hypothetical protein
MRAFLKVTLSAVALGTACFMDGPPAPATTNTFQADEPSVYVAKVKNLLTGEPASQDEISQVANASDPQSALASLIDTWMQSPQYTDIMMQFFEIAFQQTQITNADFAEMIPVSAAQALGTTTYQFNLVENIKESFARTMIALIAANRPFTDAFTTTQYMMTPPLMELYGYLDLAQPDDGDTVGGVTDGFHAQNPGVSVVVQDQTMVAMADTLNTKSQNYMVWYYPDMIQAANNAPVDDPELKAMCALHSRTYTAVVKEGDVINLTHTLHDLLYGGLDTYVLNPSVPPNCVGTGPSAANLPNDSVFQVADFSTWQMVTIHTPNDGSGATPVRFYDVPTLRTAQNLVLSTPRLGFFTTPAFQANWQTNTSNQMRVTMNQTFIVALGAQVDGSDTTVPIAPPGIPPGVDTVHAIVGSQCYQCHQTLDTSRAILQSTYSDGYGQQHDVADLATDGFSGGNGWFAFQGVVNQNINSVTDLATTLASHPLVASAWVQKLCYYATSQACDPKDPNFTAIVADFQNGFSWPNLVRELFSSPIVTNASETPTADQNGVIVSVSRSDHLCATLNNRLGLDDVCALEQAVAPLNAVVPQIAPGLPSDGYGRGESVPQLPTQPTLFYRAGTENICEAIANEIIDSTKPPAGATTYSSASQDTVNAAIADFVGNLMGLEASDPLAPQMTTLLQTHYATTMSPPASLTLPDGGVIPPASPSDALKSTFVVACSSPSVTGIGM